MYLLTEAGYSTSCGGDVPPTFIERELTELEGEMDYRRCGGNVPPTFIERDRYLSLARSMFRVVGGMFPPPSLSVEEGGANQPPTLSAW